MEGGFYFIFIPKKRKLGNTYTLRTKIIFMKKKFRKNVWNPFYECFKYAVFAIVMLFYKGTGTSKKKH